MNINTTCIVLINDALTHLYAQLVYLGVIAWDNLKSTHESSMWFHISKHEMYLQRNWNLLLSSQLALHHCH
ncbi:hypothetical protein L1987_81820 [Smallanthus sonchifolius]|uniref:Uncharacterized protein n=1 Tax=Smallanthus sonchifolius TaxID=185202 RepID=A0ACB8YRH3_9ASTR|nr:hypothetical protein L1987_81820 [Smallanthus sonchifolius]